MTVRRAGLLALLVAAAAAAGAAGCRRVPPEPNVLVISVDTLRPDFLGHGGGPEGASPHLDRLARRGAQYRRAISTTSWTLPAHMSLLTGQFPSSHGVIGDGKALNPAKRTLAEHLRERGYATAGFVSGPYLHRAYGYSQGFDVYAHCAAWGEEINERGRIANVIGVNLRSHSGVTNPAVHEAAREWLEDRRGRKPWFLFVHYWDPHYDFEPPPPYDKWRDPDWRGRFDARGFLQNPGIRPDMRERDRRRLLDLYRGEIRWTDAWIGRLLDTLEARGELDRTIVVVTADHGEEFFEHGQKGHRINLYDETLRVPLLVFAPGALEGGHLSDAPASLVDVLPTVLAAVGAPPALDAQGVDLVLAPAERTLTAELHRELDAVVDGDWKLTERRKDGRVELFDRDADPREWQNVARAHPARTRRLLEVLRSGEHAALAPGHTPEATLDERTEEELRALGYTE